MAMGKTLIVGAGVVGLMCAYELHKRGDREEGSGRPGRGWLWGKR